MLDFLFPLPVEYIHPVLLIVRLIAASILLYYGWPKIKDLPKNAEHFVTMGFKPGWFWGTIVAIVEFFGGIAMLIGLFVPIAAMLFGIQMATGVWWKKTRAKKDFTSWSYDLALFALMLAIWINGPGKYSLEFLLR